MTEGRTIRFMLNGAPVSAQVEPHWNLVDLLNKLDMTGARESCAQGLCGCCTVLVDDVAVSGCLYLAPFVDGTSVTTIEATTGVDPVQDAFIDAGALQCGFCTPGFILMTRQLLAAHPDPDDDTIRHYLAGNLCRCGAYPEIIEAVKRVAAATR